MSEYCDYDRPGAPLRSLESHFNFRSNIVDHQPHSSISSYPSHHHQPKSIGDAAAPQLADSLIHFLVEVPKLYTDSPDLDDHCMSSALLNAYAEFVARSQLPLLCLLLRYPTWSSPFSYDALGRRALSNLLRPLRALQDLYLRGVLVDNQLFEEMTLGEEGNSTDICPSLADVDISYPSSIALSFGVELSTVEAMVHSRRRTSAPVLKTVDIQLPGLQYTDIERA